jgi:hypothetical protein
MSGQKKYQVTFRRTEELAVEIEAESEFAARNAAVDLVLGKSTSGTVHATPTITVPEPVDHNVTEWSIYKMVEIVTL